MGPKDMFGSKENYSWNKKIIPLEAREYSCWNKEQFHFGTRKNFFWGKGIFNVDARENFIWDKEKFLLEQGKIPVGAR